MSTKDDRALLEAAARAAGMPIEFTNGKPVPFFEDEVLIPAWNPLEDDGDALRLAVKLRLNVCHYGDCVAATPWQNHRETEEWTGMTGADPYAATRRAIVRAAASMAKDLDHLRCLRCGDTGFAEEFPGKPLVRCPECSSAKERE